MRRVAGLERLALVSELSVERDEVVLPAAVVRRLAQLILGARLQVEEMAAAHAEKLPRDAANVLGPDVHQHLRREHGVELAVGVGEPARRLPDPHALGDPLRIGPVGALRRHGRALVEAVRLDARNLREVAQMAANPAAELEHARGGVVSEVLREHELFDVIEDLALLAGLVLREPAPTVLAPPAVARGGIATRSSKVVVPMRSTPVMSRTRNETERLSTSMWVRSVASRTISSPKR